LELGKLKEEPVKPKKGKKPGKKIEEQVEIIPQASEPEPVPENMPEEHKPGVVTLEDSPDYVREESVSKKKRKVKKMLEEEPEEPVPEITPIPEPEQLPEPEEEQGPRGRKKSKKAPEEPPEPEPAPKDEPGKASEEAEPLPESQALDDIPIVRKSLSELSEDENQVLEAIGESSMTLSGIQSKVGKHMKRFALLRALRVLIDSGHVGISAKGRMELYHRITVEKMDIPIEEKRKKEVK
jgi:hypothetical protein